METVASIHRRLDEAERLLLIPTAANLALAIKQLGPVLASMEEVKESAVKFATVAPGLVAFAEKVGERVRAQSQLLDSAWRIRLSLARAATAGLSAYSAAGDAKGRTSEDEVPKRVAATA